MNEDSAFHTLTYLIDGTTHSHDLPPGISTSFLVRVDTPGEITIWCKPHTGLKDGERDGMVATLIVE